MTKTNSILIIEDEQEVLQSLSERLEAEGYEAFAFIDAEKAFKSGMQAQVDAAIIDINLPGMSGLEATAQIRQKNNIPILLLTANSEVDFRLKGFETGADDYIIKPFFMDELIARLKAILKRYDAASPSREKYKLSDLEVDMNKKTVFRDNTSVKLSLTEFNLLVLLLEADGAPVSKNKIQQKIWKGRYDVGLNTIEVYINLLRNKIDKPFSKKLIHTKPGFGYYLADLL